MSSAGVGRPRDASIDERVLAVAASHLACSGYEAMSVSAIAEEAGTTRQAVYRRWTTKADLATAAIASLAREDRTEPTDDPFADLDVAVVSVTGGWYARALAGQRPLAGWATRTAAFIWRGLGGTVPQRPSAAGARVQRRPSPAETRSAPTTR